MIFRGFFTVGRTGGAVIAAGLALMAGADAAMAQPGFYRDFPPPIYDDYDDPYVGPSEAPGDDEYLEPFPERRRLAPPRSEPSRRALPREALPQPENDDGAPPRRARQTPPSRQTAAPAAQSRQDIAPPLPEKRGGRTAQPAQAAGVAAPVAPLDAAPAPSLAPAPALDALDKMIGQMLLAGFTGETPSDADARRIMSQIAQGAVGGALFSGRNLRSPDDAARLAGALRGVKSEHPPFIAASHEGGPQQEGFSPSKGFAPYPSAAELGLAGDPLRAHGVYAALALDLRRAGFNLNLGPVVDLTAGTGDGSRSFGADPRHVAAFARAFAIAHRDAGVATALKHFPGAAAGDASDGSQARALEPYQALLSNRSADIVIVGHASGADGRPASVSREAVLTLLRGRLGFEGVILTDELTAPVLAGRRSLEEAAVMAVEAGVDMLAVAAPEANDPGGVAARVAAALRAAVETGRLSRERIRASYERIIALKRRLAKLQETAQAR
ncbi:MAG: glycoside hydrolase family 3 N-terminal domain-containing protein [Hyphomicrobiales bacterium]|nr:glycoside hydrolase family 3 N-terminal domain-containing protein [Hyphomicrobiales bacterium]